MTAVIEVENEQDVCQNLQLAVRIVSCNLMSIHAEFSQVFYAREAAQELTIGGVAPPSAEEFRAVMLAELKAL
ncbi:hypothetical protein PsorP6_000042 [Peronosclerospora sorghi]|uniref:Uncharacterized protein n=1 Tax=Peronosclerospora sorghi TaxID=230839 RepID=A0ACC0WRN0_9STRA|nr:hypothetical protein PsorP6_000042 [Peronosclerospora sorghi]